MRAKSLRLAFEVLGVVVGAVSLAVFLPGCAGGGGGGSSTPKFPGNLSDPTITAVGTPGTLSQTPDEANAGNGTTPPPSFTRVVTSVNDAHWFRIEFPFDVERNSLLTTDSSAQPFSYLNGNITVTDVTGAHVPGVAMVNGIDAFGNDRTKAPFAGFPHDIQNGVDKNLGAGVFLFVADRDNDLSTPAAFDSYQTSPPPFPKDRKDSLIDTVHVSVNGVNGVTISAAWSFHIVQTSPTDDRKPTIVSIAAEQRDPTDPTNPATIDALSAFIVRFSEPMVPKSVGRSVELNGFPYDANLPRPPFNKPLPDATLTAAVNSNVGKLFVPFDVEPISKNNLTTYRFAPLISLPPTASVAVLIRAITNNTNTSTGVGTAAMDLSGNTFDGLYVGGVPDQNDVTATFKVGPGPAIVNIPVSPEVVYFSPSVGPGIGAIDLNGRGFNTNTPYLHAIDQSEVKLVTMWPTDITGMIVYHPGGFNIASGIGKIGHPGENGVPWNQYLYPAGTGSQFLRPPDPSDPTAVYSPEYGAGQPGWVGQTTDLGNAGTPFPGVNEGSSGPETICRDSNGDTILTGRTVSDVGNVEDMIVGDFLDRIYFDHGNFKVGNAFHLSYFGGGANTQGRNLISDPPVPNPPPTHYWVGLPEIDVVLDQTHPKSPPLLIEGDEVFTGPRLGPNAPGRAAQHGGFVQIQPNTVNPNAPDQTLFPHLWGPNGGAAGNGPGVQSATVAYTFAARQQVGNFLYATDTSTRQLHAINSNTMRVISSISLPDPTGLAITPDMKYLYVTNFSDDSLSVVVADPTDPNFHKEVARVRTGLGPRAVAAQPENEDVFVCDYLGNTISIIDPKTLSIRKQLTALINGPYDVELSERQVQQSAPHPFGWACGLYFGYISNFVGNNVLVFESGPDGPQGIGHDNVLGSLPTKDQTSPLIAPKGLCFSPLPNPQFLLAGGCFVAHKDDLGFGRVSHIQFTQQAIFGPLPIQAPPGYFIPPGFLDRVFEVTGTWGDTDASRLAGRIPSDVTLSDMGLLGYQGRPSAAPNGGGVGVAPSPEQSGYVNSKNHMRLVTGGAVAAYAPDRLYVGFEDTDVIQVLDPSQAGVILKTIAGHGNVGTHKLMSYWRE